MNELLSHVETLCGKTWQCSCGKEHAIPTRHVLISDHAINQLPNMLNMLCGSGPVIIIEDKITRKVLGDDVAQLVGAGQRGIDTVVFEPDVQADRAAVEAVASRVHTGIAALIAVGAGTINDISKMAATLESKPYFCIATAPSQNGFASPIAALCEGRIKVTRAASPPVAVLGDVATLTHAPIAMIRAGFADLLGRTTANADWFLAHVVKGEHYCARPYEITSEAEASCRQQAERIGQAEPQAVADLMSALLLSSFSMVMAGSSAPASGGEHLVSHYIDCKCSYGAKQDWPQARPLEQRLHGLQVGVATFLMARLYDNLLALSGADFHPGKREHTYPSWDSEEREIRRLYGPAAGAAIREFQKKYQPWPDKAAELSRISEMWDELRTQLRDMLLPADCILQALQGAGSPTTASDLGLTNAHMCEALLGARYLRSRYTVLDIAADTHLLDEVAATLCG